MTAEQTVETMVAAMAAQTVGWTAETMVYIEASMTVGLMVGWKG